MFRSSARKIVKDEDIEDDVFDSEDESQLDPYLPVCPFFIKYTRFDLFDDKSEFRLDSFNPFHSHDLEYHITMPISYKKGASGLYSDPTKYI
jgi:hypothetical protein